MDQTAAPFGLAEHDLLPWGPGCAKIAPHALFEPAPLSGRLILVSAMSPTAAGEGKTTAAIGLTQAAQQLGVRAACALRQPSLGPLFGIKGGGAGGGRSRLVPSQRINLHLTGDLHAIGAANNLLASLVDNAVHFQESPPIDPRRISLRRCVDMNDRFLRHVVGGLGGPGDGVPREDSFDITAASEVMAVLCLASDYADLKRRLGEIVVALGRDGAAVRVRDLHAAGAAAALLRDALLPNLVRTTEGAPALVHGGPFANVAHGCSSLVATRFGLRRAEVLFTEAGFGFDLGAEKFLDIKCRAGGFWPHALVLVATLRSLKAHGGVATADLARPDEAALDRGLENLDQHVASARRFDLDPVVALNLREGDSEAEANHFLARCHERGFEAGRIDPFARGGEGCLEVAERLLARARSATPSPRYLYDLADPPTAKIARVATEIYGAKTVEFTTAARRDLERAVALGGGALPVCIAKTHLSLSDDAKRVGRPRDFTLTVREVRLAAGAGFLVALTGEIVTMPGLPRLPRARSIDLADDGTILGAD